MAEFFMRALCGHGLLQRDVVLDGPSAELDAECNSLNQYE